MSFELFDFTKHRSENSSKKGGELDIDVVLSNDENDENDVIDEIDNDEFKKQVLDTWSYLLENKEIVLNNNELCEFLLNNKPKLVEIWFKDQYVDEETTILTSFLVNSVFYYAFLQKLLSYS